MKLFIPFAFLALLFLCAPLSADVSETWESSLLQSVFNGSADLTWTGDISSFAIEAANWTGTTDFGTSSENAIRSSNASTTVDDIYTIVTDISSTFDDSSEVTWNVYVDGNSISIQSGYWFQFVLLANTSNISYIESPDATFEGYKITVTNETIDSVDSDYIVLWKCDSTDTAWEMVDAADLGSAWLQTGWNIEVTRSAAGLWTIAHGEGSKTATITTDFTVSETSVDTSGSTWYSGMSWRTKGNTLHYNKFGFDDFAVSAISPYIDPVADAGTDQSVTDLDDSGSETVTLDATGSYDTDGTIISYIWTENSIQIATGSQPNVALSVGSHEITLTVTDDDSLTDTDTITITVNGPPEVSESWESSALQSVFSGTADLTWTGDISSFAIEAANWTGTTDFGESTEKAIRSSNASTTVDDLYTIVTDISDVFDDSLQTSWSVYVDGQSISIQSGYWFQMVLLANTNDISDIESPDAPFEGYKITITNNTIDSVDSDYIVLWKCDSTDTGWVMVDAADLGSAWLQTGWNIYVTRSAAGLWTISHGEGSKTATISTDFTVSETSVDTSGSEWYAGMSWRTKGNTLHYNKFGFDDFVVSAVDADTPPVADAGSDQSDIDYDYNGYEAITLDGTGSYDSDGTIVTYSWCEDEVEIATGSQPTVNLSPGEHIIELTVTDDDNLSDSDTVTVTVYSPPAADAGADQAIVDTDDSGDENVTLDGTISNDLDGVIVSYVWEENSAQIATGSQPSVTLDTGTHTIYLTVTDDDGLSDTDSVTITIEEPAIALESWESSALQSVFNGTGDLTWTGDTSAFAIEAADWPAGPDFGDSTEKAIRSTNASTSVSDIYTIVTDVSDEFDADDTISWNVFVSGNSISVQTSYWFQMVLLSNTSTIADIESPDADFEGYRITVSSMTYNSVYSDYLALWKCDSTDTGWVVLDAANLGSAWVSNGWNIEVTRESDGSWSVSHATGAKGTEVSLDFNVSDSTVDMTGSTWYAGMSWRSSGSVDHANKFGFDDFKIGPGQVYVNEPPVANAGGNQAMTDSDDSGYELVTLDGSLSSDNIGITSYTWSENGSTIATGVNPSVNLAVGEHDITLTVSDEHSATDTDTVTITIMEYDPNIPTTTSLSQYGITWTFSSAVQYGQFVNGDYWVIGPVTVSSVSPAPSAGKHGSMLNPSIGDGQAYDIDSAGYNANNLVSYPLSVLGNNSLVSMLCWTDSAEEHIDLTGHPIASTRTTMRTAAVLTILNSAPPTDAFRPPYSGTTKPIYRTSDIDYTALPELDVPSTDPSYDYEDAISNRDSTQTIAAQYGRYFERPWLLHMTDWVGRQCHPTDNMPGYHREVYNCVSGAAALLLTDLEDIDDLLIPFLQVGIDSYGVILTGSGGSDADSAINKWPVLLAGTLLDDSQMKSNTYRYRTEWMSYYLADRESTITSSVVTPGYTYNGYTVGWRQNPGDQEHEHLDPDTEWYLVPDGGGSKRESYRRINSHTWPGIALAAHAMGAVDDWDHDEFFDYVDRWMTEVDPYPATSPASGSTTNGFVTDMWDTYRDDY